MNWIAFILAIFFMQFGLGRFWLGCVWTGFLQLSITVIIFFLTTSGTSNTFAAILGVFMFIWWIADLYWMWTGALSKETCK